MSKLPIQRIQGSDIQLEPFSCQFVTIDYLRWMNDKETTRFIQKAQGKTSIDDLHSFVNQMIDSDLDYFFAILLKKDQRHVGNVRLGPIDFVSKKSHFGIMIGEKDLRGCGVGTEVVELIKQFSFEYLDLDRLSFPVVKKYLAAMKLYEKTGFTISGSIDQTFNKNGKSWELIEYSMDNPYRIEN
jgi:RimJ/RimL family protein N-acetyltransferase